MLTDAVDAELRKPVLEIGGRCRARGVAGGPSLARDATRKPHTSKYNNPRPETAVARPLPDAGDAEPRKLASQIGGRASGIAGGPSLAAPGPDGCS